MIRTRNHLGPSNVHYSLVSGQAFSFDTQYKKLALVESLFRLPLSQDMMHFVEDLVSLCSISMINHKGTVG